MRTPPEKTVEDVARDLARYSIDAFEFLREGLDFTVQQRHGDTVHMIRKILVWLEENDYEEADLAEVFQRGEFPQDITRFITQQGGPDAIIQRLNLHVGGRDLCLGLRDLALERWGLMAPTVLQSWGVRTTLDFGRMVFALVENDLLQKQPEDQLGDFESVYDFKSAFESAYKIDLVRNAKAAAKVEK